MDYRKIWMDKTAMGTLRQHGLIECVPEVSLTTNNAFYAICKQKTAVSPP